MVAKEGDGTWFEPESGECLSVAYTGQVSKTTRENLQHGSSLEIFHDIDVRDSLNILLNYWASESLHISYYFRKCEGKRTLVLEYQPYEEDTPSFSSCAITYDNTGKVEEIDVEYIDPDSKEPLLANFVRHPSQEYIFAYQTLRRDEDNVYTPSGEEPTTIIREDKIILAKGLSATILGEVDGYYFVDLDASPLVPFHIQYPFPVRVDMQEAEAMLNQPTLPLHIPE